MKGFTREFLLASAVHVLCLAWVFHKPLLSGQVFIPHAAIGAAPDAAIADMSEQLFQLQPVLYTGAKIIKSGVFPGWTPYPQAGTPLIGKMMNGVFSPFHALFYALPLAWLPALFMLVIALKSYFAFAFTYLYARAMRLGWPAAVLAATLFVFQGRMFVEYLYATWGSALYLPLLLLLVELYFRGHVRSASLLIPWGVALAFFSGHFESAFRVALATSVYFLLRLRGAHPSLGPAWRHVLRLGAAVLAGLLIAGCQIVPGAEYVGLSYNQVWRSLAEYGWEYATIYKHLSWDDAQLLVMGLGALWAAWAAFRRASAAVDQGPAAGGPWLYGAAAAAALAASCACLANIGFDDSFQSIISGTEPARWLVRALLIFLSFWVWRQPGQLPGLRALGWVLLGSLLVTFKTPPLSNLLASLPLFKNFNNTVYLCEYDLALAVLSAAALQYCESLAKSGWKERSVVAGRALLAVGVLLAGHVAAQPLKGAVARRIPAGLAHNPRLSPPPDGGIMGPERLVWFNRKQVLAGWVPNSRQLAGVGLVLSDGQKAVDSKAAELEPTTPVSRRQYFHAEFAWPQSTAQLRAVAVVRQSNGQQIPLPGPRIDLMRRPAPWLLATGILLFVLIPLCGSVLSRLAFLSLLLIPLWPLPVPGLPSSQFPFRVPGLDKVRADPSLFRVSTLSGDTFFHADYSNLYDLHDIRNGGDNLDVRNLVCYFSFAQRLLHSAQGAGLPDLGLRLLGLGNVKYLIDRPRSSWKLSGLQQVYDGPDVSVYRNLRAGERAAFFDSCMVVPVDTSPGHWRRLDEDYQRVLSAVGGSRTDLSRTLLLHDAPSLPLPAAAAGSGTVRVEEYLPNKVRLAVEAQRPGLVQLSDNWFPGWEANLDGKPARILRSWFTFRAVEVPAGRCVVEFVYRPLKLWLAAALSAVLALVWLGLYAFGRAEPPPAAAAAVQLPSGSKKKKGVPQPLPPLDAEPELSAACARWGEGLLVGLVGFGLAYWTLWGGFIYKGDRWISAAAWAALAAGLGAVILGIARRNPTPSR